MNNWATTREFPLILVKRNIRRLIVNCFAYPIDTHIYVNGIINVQLLELATRNYWKEFVAVLAKCIEKESTVSGVTKDMWKSTEENVGRLYDPHKGAAMKYSTSVFKDGNHAVL